MEMTRDTSLILHNIPLLLLYILLSTSSSISDRRTDRTWVVTVNANTPRNLTYSARRKIARCITTNIKTTVYHHFNSNIPLRCLLNMVKICQSFNKQPLLFTGVPFRQKYWSCSKNLQTIA